METESRIEVITNTIPDEEKQNEIIQKAVEFTERAQNEGRSLSDVVDEFKTWLDTNHDRAWQVMILSGSYYLKNSHESENFIVFKYENHIYLAWLTPE